MQQREKNIMWIIIGIVLFILPMSCYPFVREFLDETNYENRNMVERPVMSVSSYSTYAQQYEQYFNDHLPYRNLFVKNMNLIKHYVFNENVGQVINGKDGWLFYSGANAIAYYKRDSYFPEEYMQEVVQNLSEIDQRMQEQNIQFCVLLLPNKEEVYEEYMPDYYIRPEIPNRTDVLANYIWQYSDIMLVYPKTELREEKDEYQLYFKHDTHYNCLGAFIAYEQVIASLGKERIYLSECEVNQTQMSDRISGKNDLEKMMGFSGVLEEDYEYYLSEYPLLEDWEKEEYNNQNAVNDERVLLVGDSFRISLLPYLSKGFENVKVVDFTTYSQEILEEYQPDIVIWELLERNDEQLKDFRFYNSFSG